MTQWWVVWLKQTLLIPAQVENNKHTQKSMSVWLLVTQRICFHTLKKSFVVCCKVCAFFRGGGGMNLLFFSFFWTSFAYMANWPLNSFYPRYELSRTTHTVDQVQVYSYRNTILRIMIPTSHYSHLEAWHGSFSHLRWGCTFQTSFRWWNVAFSWLLIIFCALSGRPKYNSRSSGHGRVSHELWQCRKGKFPQKNLWKRQQWKWGRNVLIHLFNSLCLCRIWKCCSSVHSEFLHNDVIMHTNAHNWQKTTISTFFFL